MSSECQKIWPRRPGSEPSGGVHQKSSRMNSFFVHRAIRRHQSDPLLWNIYWVVTTTGKQLVQDLDKFSRVFGDFQGPVVRKWISVNLGLTFWINPGFWKTTHSSHKTKDNPNPNLDSNAILRDGWVEHFGIIPGFWITTHPPLS